MSRRERRARARGRRACVRASAVLYQPIGPRAVVTASFRGGRGTDTGTVETYVWLAHEEREETERHLGYAPTACRDDGFPALVRGYAIDPETGALVDGAPLGYRAGTWCNAEGMWVHARCAPGAVAALERWRARHADALPASSIGAPNWTVMTAVRALAIGAGLPDPRGAAW